MTSWIYEDDIIVSARGMRRRGTDAGTAPHTGDRFVVEAKDKGAALDAARCWLACWADEEEQNVPDGLGLIQRRGYVALSVPMEFDATAYSRELREAEARYSDDIAAIEEEVNHLGGEMTVGEIVAAMIRRGWRPPAQ